MCVVDELVSLRKMQVTSCIYLVVITIATGFALSLTFALSVFAGGVISILSFWVAHTDIIHLITTLTETTDPEQRKEKAKKGRGGYLLKFWIRIAIIGVILLILIKSKWLNVFGLILGLSTVVFTITFTVLNVARHYFFSARR